MIKTIAIVIVVVIAAILIFAATKPETFTVQRAASIKAPPEKIFAVLDDFHNWGVWSPWEKMDPDMKRTFSGAANGKGAVYEWQGNSKVGQGRMEIHRRDCAHASRDQARFHQALRGTQRCRVLAPAQRETPRTSRGPCAARAPT
jgi:hypothetical protein